MNTFHIQAAASLTDTAALSDAEFKRHLKQYHGLDGRRLSRTSMLALAGGLAACELAQPAARCGIYLGAVFGSSRLFHSMLNNVLDQQVAKPFDLLANLHNAPVFHLAAAIGSQETGLLVPVSNAPSVWPHPLLLAANDLMAGAIDGALVGWCHEAQPHIDDRQEGSHWLLLSPGNAAGHPMLHPVPASEAAPQPPRSDGGYYLQNVADFFTDLTNPAYCAHLPLSTQTSLAAHGAAGWPFRLFNGQTLLP